MITRITIVLFVTLVSSAFHAAPASGLESSDANVDRIIDHYATAIGGLATAEKVSTRITSGTWENTSNGIKCRFATYAKAPDRYLFTLIDLPGNKPGERGFDGTHGWSLNMTETGMRMLSGNELESARRSATFNADLKLKSLFSDLKFIGIEKSNGANAEVILATPSSGAPEKFCFDVETGLMVEHDEEFEGKKGTTVVRHYFSDYKSVDGIKIPFLRRNVSSAFETITKVEKVENNVPIDDKKFQYHD
jgi:hypothetical protein